MRVAGSGPASATDTSLLAKESSWLSLPESSDESAAAFRQLGRALASRTAYWGSDGGDIAIPDGPAPPETSAIRVEERRHGIRIMVPDRVGVIAVGDTVIRITPKLNEAHVLHLLRVATGLDRALTTAETRVLADTASGFWEILARSYLFEVERLLRTDPIREYERRTDDLPFVRGSLILAPTARAFFSGKLRFRSRYSRLSVDTPLNRIVRAALIRVASNPMSGAVLRLAATRLRAWLDDVGEMRSDDRTVKLDRRTSHYRAARELAGHVLDGSVQGWDAAGNAAMAFLIRTPLLVQRGIATILNRNLGPETATRARTLLLHGPSGRTVNPDLVFEPGPSGLADVKYRQAPAQWRRGDVYEVVSFGRHAGCRRVAIIDFSSSDARRPSLGFGEHPSTSTWVSHLAWPLDEVDPIQAEERITDEVRQWLASDRGLH